MSSVLKQLIIINDAGNILISEIKETVEMGKKDKDTQIGQLFGDCWTVLEALVKQEIHPIDCLTVINEIVERLEEKVLEKTGSEKMRILQLIARLKQHVVHDYLLQII